MVVTGDMAKSCKNTILILNGIKSLQTANTTFPKEAMPPFSLKETMFAVIRRYCGVALSVTFVLVEETEVASVAVRGPFSALLSRISGLALAGPLYLGNISPPARNFLGGLGGEEEWG